MNAEALKPPRLPYNPRMLRWAREWRGRTIEESATKIGVAAERLRGWESSIEEDAPTVRQARDLAHFYNRAFLEFFYDEQPEIVEPDPIPDYRLHRGAPDPRQNRDILEIQRWAQMQRVNALELYDDIGEPVPTFPPGLHATLNDDVEQIAIRARSVLAFPLAFQKGLNYDAQRRLPDFLRERLEGAGVLVMRENKLTTLGVSGLCIVQFPLPIIVFAAESPGRSAFTLMHEFAHIVLRESAISGADRVSGGNSHDRTVERWCDRFAAAFLIPRAELEELRHKPVRPAPSISDIALAELARAFRVSQHAMLVRLVHLENVRHYTFNDFLKIEGVET